MFWSPANGLTLSKNCADTTSTSKDIGPPIIHLFNINKIINIGLGNIEFCSVGTEIFSVSNQQCSTITCTLSSLTESDHTYTKGINNEIN